MHDPLETLFSSVEKQSSYWKQVALLEFLQSLESVKAAQNIRTNKEFAKLLGVSEPTLSRWLNGIENITVGTMCRLATALGAAVHIHVADNTEKGRWRAEPGEVRARDGHNAPKIRSPEAHVTAKLLNFPGYMPDVGRRVNRKTLSGTPPFSPELAESHG